MAIAIMTNTSKTIEINNNVWTFEQKLKHKVKRLLEEMFSSEIELVLSGMLPHCVIKSGYRVGLQES
jgi:putative flippase GtrA